MPPCHDFPLTLRRLYCAGRAARAGPARPVRQSEGVLEADLNDPSLAVEGKKPPFGKLSSHRGVSSGRNFTNRLAFNYTALVRAVCLVAVGWPLFPASGALKNIARHCSALLQMLDVRGGGT